MSYVMVDIESDGPIPGDYSMISFGAVIVEPSLAKTFHGQLRPISERWIPEALAVSGYTRDQTMGFPDAESVMRQFQAWLAEHAGGRPMFISDNNGFDWQFINWYFHHFLGTSPFGFSSTNLGSLYKGVVRDTTQNFKHLRRTPHTHHPVDDAKGNAEALLTLKDEFQLRFACEAALHSQILAMGYATAKITLHNPRHESMLPVEVEALADTGSLHLCIPEHLAIQLDLKEIYQREVTTADGKRHVVPYVGPLQITFGNRGCFGGAIVLGDQVLLGAVQMEDMDLVVSPPLRKVVPNPDSPNIPTALAKGLR